MSFLTPILLLVQTVTAFYFASASTLAFTALLWAMSDSALASSAALRSASELVRAALSDLALATVALVFASYSNLV